ncbi:hypothetical protein Pla52o_45660 [Novipirellula galeiformis]|uniref:Uncharacterized protein n=1 Tax=Novipirellula galeiformis TaxID=2528004 RepID=A0A5C6C9T1_9BACT|nr:hypothetical protein Pla52o_45660 [Novipirellula galeiformis]
MVYSEARCSLRGREAVRFRTRWMQMQPQSIKCKAGFTSDAFGPLGFFEVETRRGEGVRDAHLSSEGREQDLATLAQRVTV